MNGKKEKHNHQPFIELAELVAERAENSDFMELTPDQMQTIIRQGKHQQALSELNARKARLNPNPGRIRKPFNQLSASGQRSRLLRDRNK